jgi:hypothetical protein
MAVDLTFNHAEERKNCEIFRPEGEKGKERERSEEKSRRVNDQGVKNESVPFLEGSGCGEGVATWIESKGVSP